jgi:hypothetical protein
MMRKPISDSDSPTVAEVYKLSKAEREAVEEARVQFARGEVLTAEEAEQEIQAFFDTRQNPDKLSERLK